MQIPWLNKWTTGLEPVQRARSSEERDAILRLRYRIYVEELNKIVPEADHERRWVHDPEDDLPRSALFYTGRPERPTGTLRLTVWAPGTAPEALRERYALAQFPGIDRYPIAEASRLLVEPQVRGMLVVPALVKAAYDHVVLDEGVQFCFSYCAPGLVNSYKRLGYRPYHTDSITTSDGLRVPIVMLTSDVGFFKQVHSPLAAFASAYVASERLSRIDLSPYAHLVSQDHQSVQLDPRQVWHELQDELLDGERERPGLLDDLTPSDLRKLATQGVILDVSAGQLITREDLHEQEMFVILEGCFEIRRGVQRLALLHHGEVFGEMALLLNSGRRTATVVAQSEGRLLVLRRKFVQELMHRDPDIAAKILYNLSRTLAERVARTSATLVDAQLDAREDAVSPGP